MTEIELRLLAEDDVAVIAEAFSAIGWDKPASQYLTYLRAQSAGEKLVWVARRKGVFEGYICLDQRSSYAPFGLKQIPEICDLNVLPAHRRRGLGSALLDEAEREAFRTSPVVGLRVGLTSDYMDAFRLYLARGYRLAGEGISYRGSILDYGDQVQVDDDLCLSLTKSRA